MILRPKALAARANNVKSNRVEGLAVAVVRMLESCPPARGMERTRELLPDIFSSVHVLAVALVRTARAIGLLIFVVAANDKTWLVAKMVVQKPSSNFIAF
mmetsp:Transcript_15529/g.23836  ORF Transcript_15529/g.23836 Transcript_15529/m.23836 type:complete len:100 (+) Transcript_15529:1380-1679(+)